MVTAITATPAAAQRTLSNGQVWHNGRIMPPARVSPNPPSHNPPPGVVWNTTQPAGVSANPPHFTPPPRVSPNPPYRNGPRTGHQWSGNGQWSGGGQWGGGQRMTRPIQPGPRQHRWGGSVGGRWYGGSNAPGGWSAYRRPSRGWTLPRYWIAPSFFISDYGLYGLSTPPRGYNWTRYYDDAVLTDSRGRVYDSIGGIDWDSYDDDYGYGDDDGYGGGGGSAEASSGYGYASAAGGGGGYTTSYSTGSAYAGAGGYVSGGYWYPPVTTTTITVQSAPVVTTTTTEYVETTSYRPARRVYYAPRRKTKVRVCDCR
jgi:Ni/Co efflux regulator RcnB